mmetsp:Transcript_4692/g.11143  ORF Transcript_4692/g.11143 Transcript_4692/m.11143 type:complete len:134 (-) Transcript_4692:49-450(-)
MASKRSLQDAGRSKEDNSDISSTCRSLACCHNWLIRHMLRQIDSRIHWPQMFRSDPGRRKCLTKPIVMDPREMNGNHGDPASSARQNRIKCNWPAMRVQYAEDPENKMPSQECHSTDRTFHIHNFKFEVVLGI